MLDELRGRHMSVTGRMTDGQTNEWVLLSLNQIENCETWAKSRTNEMFFFVDLYYILDI